jgi:hypothetical protein
MTQDTIDCYATTRASRGVAALFKRDSRLKAAPAVRIHTMASNQVSDIITNP